MDTEDLGRIVEDVLMTLAKAKDKGGLGIVLPVDHQITVLAAAIIAIQNASFVAPLFRPVGLEPQFGEVTDG